MIDVDCANCAAKMEQAVNTVEGIVSASVNYMALKMSVEFAEGADVKKVMGEVLKKCRRIEPDCEIYY